MTVDFVITVPNTERRRAGSAPGRPGCRLFNSGRADAGALARILVLPTRVRGRVRRRTRVAAGAVGGDAARDIDEGVLHESGLC